MLSEILEDHGQKLGADSIGVSLETIASRPLGCDQLAYPKGAAQ